MVDSRQKSSFNFMEEEALVLVLTNETKEKISKLSGEDSTYKEHDVKKL